MKFTSIKERIQEKLYVMDVELKDRIQERKNERRTKSITKGRLKRIGRDLKRQTNGNVKACYVETKPEVTIYFISEREIKNAIYDHDGKIIVDGVEYTIECV